MTRFVASQPGVPARRRLLDQLARAPRRPPTGRSALRITPAPTVIACCSSGTTSASTRPGVRRSRRRLALFGQTARPGARRSGGRTPALRAASSRRAGWRRARRCTRPRRTRTGRAPRCGRAGRSTRRRTSSGRPARPGSARVTGSIPCDAAGRQDGREPDPPLLVAEVPGVEADVVACRSASIWRMIAFATTSRGARSASSCWPCMNRLPSWSTRNAPSPRTASDTSGCWPLAPSPSHSTVGWNCTNSRSRICAPARSASAIPSPVETLGLVVAAYNWPIPPVASTTARQRIAPTPSSWPSPITCRVTPGDGAVLGVQQVEHQRVLDQPDVGGPARRRRPAPARSRRRSRRRRRARSGCGGGRPRGSARARPSAHGVEARAEVDQLADRVRALR